MKSLMLLLSYLFVGNPSELVASPHVASNAAAKSRAASASPPADVDLAPVVAPLSQKLSPAADVAQARPSKPVVKTCPIRPAVSRCLDCPPQRCVDGQWVSEPAPKPKTCTKPPPRATCAGAIGFCPVWKCADGEWIDARPARKGGGKDPLL